VGRRHLIGAAAIAALALWPSAPTGAAALRWRVLADGPAGGRPVTAPVAYVVLDRAASTAFASRLGPASAKLARVDYSTSALVVIFGEFGCEDSLVEVAALAQQGASLSVRLIDEEPPPNTARCMAIFGTYRVLAVPKASLRTPYPTRALVTLARS
jgi:hypothetical protein